MLIWISFCRVSTFELLVSCLSKEVNPRSSFKQLCEFAFFFLLFFPPQINFVSMVICEDNHFMFNSYHGFSGKSVDRFKYTPDLW